MPLPQASVHRTRAPLRVQRQRSADANWPSVVSEEALIELVEPCVECLGDRQGVVVHDLATGTLSLPGRVAILEGLHQLLCFLNNFVALGVAHVGDVPALVMADV